MANIHLFISFEVKSRLVLYVSVDYERSREKLNGECQEIFDFIFCSTLFP
jgi:hypothetical protein